MGVMYEEFYGLTEKPFSIQPDPSFLYWGRGHRLAYAMLEYGVVNQAGISVITGEVGCGKTTLIHRLLDQLSDTHTVALLSNIQAGRGELLSWVLMGFGEPYAGKTHVEMFAQLQQFFIREYAKGKRVVLIIDEAQNLSVDMLEELRMLSNINAGKDQLLQLILVGQPQLKDLLSRPDMLQLAQRIGSDFHLTPLTREEVRAYIETRLTIAGAKQGIFTAKAMDLIAEQSRGVPRVINIIADTALVYAFSAQVEFVDDEMIRSVIRDKLDYGVFGLASSPDLKLAESGDARRASGFLREAPKTQQADNKSADLEQMRQASAARLSGEARDAPRIVSNISAKLSTTDSASLAYEAGATAGGPPVYETATVQGFRTEDPSRRAAPAREAQTVVRNEAPLVASRAPSPEFSAPSAEDAAAEEIGIVVIGGGKRMIETALSAPDDVSVVCVAAPGPEADAAREAELEFVELDIDSVGGGRARNAGYRRLKKIAPGLKYAQFIEAGPIIDADWLEKAARFMARRPEVAALEGVTIETAPATSLFRRVADEAGAKPEGEAQSTGPNALFRADAFEAAGGFRGDIIADATADLCIRLRRRGAHVWRSDAAMALVEPAEMSFGEWRRRATANGFAYAAGAALHGGPPERYCATEQARAVMWGAVFPAIVALAAGATAAATAMFASDSNPLAAATGVIVAGLLVYAAKIAAVAFSAGPMRPFSWVYGALTTLGHFPEFFGVVRYWFGARMGPGARKSAAERQ
ncbi:MAG: AAA family ATPase [Pseudomonadota bacterium]